MPDERLTLLPALRLALLVERDTAVAPVREALALRLALVLRLTLVLRLALVLRLTLLAEEREALLREERETSDGASRSEDRVAAERLTDWRLEREAPEVAAVREYGRGLLDVP